MTVDFTELEQFLSHIRQVLHGNDQDMRRLSASALIATYTNALLEVEKAKEMERNALRELGAMIVEQDDKSTKNKPEVRA